MKNPHFIQAISPLDGRYQEKLKGLKNYWSEYALIKFRIHVEIEWLISLARQPEIDCITKIDNETETRLKSIYKNLSVDDSLQVKEIEMTTNHDVKAVEYYILEKLKEFKLETMGISLYSSDFALIISITFWQEGIVISSRLCLIIRA